MPSCCSSQAVSRAPCRNGRVSSAKTSIFLPALTAARITPSAVPYPAVASAPALQCVSTVLPSGTRSAPFRPMAWQMAMSSSRIFCASEIMLRTISSLAAPCSEAIKDRIRSMPQNRFTAVGRVAARVLQTVSKSSPAWTPRATPIAAATPIAGAPRITMVLIASATSRYVRQVTKRCWRGRRVWSIITTPASVHWMVSTMNYLLCRRLFPERYFESWMYRLASGRVLIAFCLAGAYAAGAVDPELRGHVKDENDAPVAAARVTLRRAAASAPGPWQTQTDPAGAFTLAVPDPGDYLLSVAREGYYELKDRPVHIEGTLELTLTLSSVREVFQSVDVHARPAPVDLAQTTNQERLTGTEVNDILYPNSHSFRNSMKLMPGVAEDAGGG